MENKDSESIENNHKTDGRTYEEKDTEQQQQQQSPAGKYI